MPLKIWGVRWVAPMDADRLTCYINGHGMISFIYIIRLWNVASHQDQYIGIMFTGASAKNEVLESRLWYNMSYSGNEKQMFFMRNSVSSERKPVLSSWCQQRTGGVAMTLSNGKLNECGNSYQRQSLTWSFVLHQNIVED